MREVSGAGTRGLFTTRGCLFAWLACVLALTGARDARAQTFGWFFRETGHINFVTTGGSLRTQDNNGNSCAVSTTSTQSLSGIPVTASVYKAYLYWGGSGGTADTSVTLNNISVTAQGTFSDTYTGVTPSLPYFGAYAEVTSLVSGNGSYTFGGLNVVTGSPHCDVSAVAAGWSLVVIYKADAERLRAINLYHGLRSFRGQSITQTPDGFRVPNSNIDGRIAVFTLEGDPGNSGTMNGIDEALRFNGNLLDDGINVPGSDPVVQQFDGTINTQGVSTSYGIDVDQYDVSAYLSPGQTSATTVYSAGADLVLLMMQVVSATSDPAVDVGITMSHTGTFVSGGTGTYTITVSNAAGMEREDNTVTVSGTLPAGLTFNSGTGTGWTCGAAGQVVTCTHPATLDAGASFPALSLVVNVAEAAAASFTTSMSVSTPSYELNTTNNTANDLTATIDPNVSTSTKSVVDLNGGEASPGDTLRYTITLNESAGGQAINVSLTDSIPDNTTFGGFVSIPPGATSAFTPAPAGANALGLLTVSGITVPASGNVTVVFDVTVTAGTLPGEVVNNTATINNPNGPENNPAAPTVTVNPSLIPQTGTKFLYLHRDGSGNKSLSRVVPSGSDTNETVVNGAPDQFTIAPPLRTAFSIAAGGIPVRLWLTRSSNTPGGRTITVTLTASDGFTTSANPFVTPPTGTTPTVANFTLPNATAHTFPVGTTFTLTVSQNGTNNVIIYPNGNGVAGNNSRIEFNATTVINVDSVLAYNAAFNGGAVQTTFYPGATVYVRAQVSDPFGSFDIGGARVTIIDPANATQVNNVAMTAQGAPATCNSQAAATCIYQYAYTVPASPALGGWTVRVTASEGTEGTVTDLGVGNFIVAIPQPSLTMVKTSTVLTDPVNNATNPKRIPNSVVRYDITLTNSGPGTVDAGTLVITDPIPANASMYVSTASGNPVVFVNGSTPSGLTFTYASHVSYSSTGASGPWTYTPVPDANGFDAAVRAVRIAPAGTMSAAGSGNPSFTLQFRVRIN